jgi:drug/metabolite transporter (DMT)-like permease
MAAVLLALGASVSWGFGDFIGPLKGRTLGTLRVLFLAQLAGLATMAVVVAARAEGPPGAAVLLAVPAALCGTLGLVALYRGMAAGAMSVVAPIAGVSAALPVVVGIATGDRPSALQIGGIVLALAGVGVTAREPRAADAPRVAAGVGLALLAALGFGLYFVPMHAAGNADPAWAAFIFRMTSVSLVGTAVLVRRPSLRIDRVDLAFVAAAGVLDTTGNLLFAAASAYGLVSVTSVLASLYPVVTIVLAHRLLHERTAPAQKAGIGATLAGVALIAGG